MNLKFRLLFFFMGMFTFPGFSQQTVSLDNTIITALEVVNGTIFAGVYSGRIVYSPDSGKTWIEAGLGVCDTASLAYDRLIYDFEAVGDTIYVATACGIFRSAINGLQWKSFSEGLPDRCLKLYSFQGTLFAGTGSGICRFEKDSAKWIPLTDGVPVRQTLSPYCEAIIHQDTVLFATFELALYNSKDGGDSWSPLGSNPVIVPAGISHWDSVWATHVNGIALLCTIQDSLLAVSYNGAVFRSTNLGATWVLTRVGCYYCSNPIILDACADAGGVFLGSCYNQVLVSHDAGLTWQTTGYAIDARPYRLARIGNYTVVGTEGKGIFFSNDDFGTYSRYISGPVKAKGFGRQGSSQFSFGNGDRVGIVVVYDIKGRMIGKMEGRVLTDRIGKNVLANGVYIVRENGIEKGRKFLVR